MHAQTVSAFHNHSIFIPKTINIIRKNIPCHSLWEPVVDRAGKLNLNS